MISATVMCVMSLIWSVYRTGDLLLCLQPSTFPWLVSFSMSFFLRTCPRNLSTGHRIDSRRRSLGCMPRFLRTDTFVLLMCRPGNPQHPPVTCRFKGLYSPSSGYPSRKWLSERRGLGSALFSSSCGYIHFNLVGVSFTNPILLLISSSNPPLFVTWAPR